MSFQRISLFLGLLGIIILANFILTSILRVYTEPIVEYGSIILYDQYGKKITERGKSGGYMIPYSGSYQALVIEDIIKIEDSRFYYHNGVDFLSKLSSLYTNIKAGGIVRGGSTITEQYIKNAYYPNASRTIIQKIREAIGATVLEIRYTKKEILEKYLNSLYFGNRIYGIHTAIEVYYPGVSIDDLKNDDIVDIITRIHSPNVTDKNLNSVIKYREHIASRLGIKVGESKLISQKRVNYIDDFPLVSAKIIQSIQAYCSGNEAELGKFMISTDTEICGTTHISIHLSLDAQLMRFINKTVEGVLTSLAHKNVHNAAVYIYNPRNQKVLAYIGNINHESNGSMIDMIHERRSVGSLLKPFIYLLALRDGADSESFIMDSSSYSYPTEYTNKVFIPQNYIPKSYGPVRIREALGNSLNSATVRITETIGIGKVYNFLRDIGLDINHDAGYYGYGISIGTVELSLANIVESYSYLLQTDEKDIFLIRTILEDSSNRAKTFGISSILNSSIPVPVKTGTSTDFRDNWTLSYHPDAIVGVWVGNSNAEPMTDVSGVSGAGPIWHQIIEYLIKQGKIDNSHWKKMPKGIEKNMACLDAQCFQKELRFSKIKSSQKSRPRDQIYYSQDFYTPLTEDEKFQWNIR